MLNLIKQFTSAFSVSGREVALASIIEKEIKPFVDSTETDALGNLIAFKKGADSSKRLMIAAHMDEIGFVASYITDKGFIRVDKVGGISPLYSAYGRVRFENGVTGVIVTDASAKGELKVKDLVIDIGAKSEMYTLMEELASQGKSVIMISSELSEIQRLSDRVIVMCEGRITGELDIKDATQEKIMAYATMREE